MSDPIQPWPVVRRGDEGHPVVTLQELLRAHGRQIAADGVFGPATESAVKAIQAGRGLAADGIVGALTWPVTVVTVRRGSRGAAVRAVQVEIEYRNLSGMPGLAIDGVFGALTEQSVRGFQQALSIAVDGIVGPVTWRAYVSGMLSL